MTPQLISEKLIDSDEMAAYPGAAVTDSFVMKIKLMYDAKVLESRAEILYDLAKNEYGPHNITKYAITTLAKEKKIHYFLTNDKERIINAVIRRFS